MARRVRYTSRIDRFMTQIRGALGKRTLLEDIADFIRLRIYQNTKRGYYAGIRKNLSKFRPLSPGYIEFRRQLVKALTNEKLGRSKSKKQARAKAIKELGPFFGPARSNLTLTGQMLESLDSSVDATKQQVTISVKDTQRDDDSGLTNAQVAVKVAAAGRPFLGLDQTGKDRVVRLVIASLRRSLKRR